MEPAAVQVSQQRASSLWQPAKNSHLICMELQEGKKQELNFKGNFKLKGKKKGSGTPLQPTRLACVAGDEATVYNSGTLSVLRQTIIHYLWGSPRH